MTYSVSEVAHGMRQGQIRLALEPQLDLGSGKVLGFECLARWLHPRDGCVAPAHFIPQLERCGLIGQLTLIVIGRALSLRQRLRDHGLDIPFSVNISAQSLIDWNFSAEIARLSQASGDDLKGFTLEVTESSVLSDDALSGECIRALKALGLRLSMDDFWTGYSSLSKPCLECFDEVKIDYQLTRRIEEDKVALAGVSSIQAFARMLGWRCVVEGIESLESLETVSLLRAIGCTVGQGYLFARPIEEDLIEDWLRTKTPKGCLEFLHSGISDVNRSLPVSDVAQFREKDRSVVPIWMFNIDRLKMHWGNEAALRLWKARTLSDFVARDYAADMSDSVLQRLSTLRDLLKSGCTVAEQWTFYPLDEPIQVYAVMKGSCAANGDFLLEVHGFEGIGPAAAKSLETPTADMLPIPSIAIHEDGTIYWRNAAAGRAFKELETSLFTACHNPAEAAAFVARLLRDGTGTTTLRIKNHRCSVPCRVEGIRARDPASGKRGVILSMTQLCDIMGCSYEAAVSHARVAGEVGVQPALRNLGADAATA